MSVKFFLLGLITLIVVVTALVLVPSWIIFAGLILCMFFAAAFCLGCLIEIFYDLWRKE